MRPSLIIRTSSLIVKLQSFAVNRTLLSFDDGTEIYFSYETPVAGYNPRLGFVKTKQWYSSTTTRHINRYLNEYADVPCPEHNVHHVEQSAITNLVKTQIPSRY